MCRLFASLVSLAVGKWRCGGVNRVGQTGAFCVSSVSECQAAQCDRRTHSDAVVQRSVHPATQDKTVAPACRPPPQQARQAAV